MHRFYLTPHWIAAHLLFLLLQTAFVSLGLWQLDRRADRRAEIAVIQSRTGQQELDLNRLLEADASRPAGPRDHSFRRATVRGTFDFEREILLEGRSDLGRPGRHVVTPLVTGGSSALLVNRGWVPMGLDGPPVPEARPPSVQVTLTGVLLPAQEKASFGREDPALGRLRTVTRIDPERLSQQLPYRIFPLVLQLQEQRPPNAGPLPKTAPPPKLDEGPHLSYAIQWFSFSAIAAATYLAYIRKQAVARLYLRDDSRSREAA